MWINVLRRHSSIVSQSIVRTWHLQCRMSGDQFRPEVIEYHEDIVTSRVDIATELVHGQQCGDGGRVVQAPAAVVHRRHPVQLILHHVHRQRMTSRTARYVLTRHKWCMWRHHSVITGSKRESLLCLRRTGMALRLLLCSITALRRLPFRLKSWTVNSLRTWCVLPFYYFTYV